MEFSSWDSDIYDMLKINENLDDDKRDEYKFLLDKKMELEKEAEFYDLEYLQKFGTLIETGFKLKIQCIKLKKILAIYFKMKNLGKNFNVKNAMNQLIDELKPYYIDLENLKNVINDKGKTISEYTIKQIKKIYKEIVNLIHPDIAPELSNNRKIQNLWNEATKHYKCNQFEKLQEVYFLIMDELVTIGYDINKKINVFDIDNKISKLNDEISDIISNNPYQLKYLLENPDEVKEKEKELNLEVKMYTDYYNNLLSELEDCGIDVHKFDQI